MGRAKEAKVRFTCEIKKVAENNQFLMHLIQSQLNSICQSMVL